MAEARHRDQTVIGRQKELDIAHLERRQELDMADLAMYNILPKKKKKCNHTTNSKVTAWTRSVTNRQTDTRLDKLIITGPTDSVRP